MLIITLLFSYDIFELTSKKLNGIDHTYLLHIFAVKYDISRIFKFNSIASSLIAAILHIFVMKKNIFFFNVIVSTNYSMVMMI